MQSLKLAKARLIGRCLVVKDRWSMNEEEVDLSSVSVTTTSISRVISPTCLCLMRTVVNPLKNKVMIVRKHYFSSESVMKC